jgi:hypothetical protein
LIPGSHFTIFLPLNEKVKKAGVVYLLLKGTYKKELEDNSTIPYVQHLLINVANGNYVGEAVVKPDALSRILKSIGE